MQSINLSAEPPNEAASLLRHPACNDSKKNREFYDKQTAIQGIVDANKEAAIKQASIVKDMREKPRLCKKTITINDDLVRKGKIPITDVFERLQIEKDHAPIQAQEFTHRPTISSLAATKKRPMRIDIFLYEDAMAKQQQQREPCESTHQRSTSSSSSSSQKNSLKSVTTKLNREFQETVAIVASSVNPRRTPLPETLSYLEVAEVLSRLGYLNL